MALDERPEAGGNTALLKLCGWLADPAGWYRGETALQDGARGLLAAVAGGAILRGGAVG